MELPEMNKLFCAAALAVFLSGCATVEFGDKVAHAGPPTIARIELTYPVSSFLTRLTAARVDQVACTFESADPEFNRKIRARLFENMVVTVPVPKGGYEPWNKLVFYFDDGKVETLVFSKHYSNRDAIDADWQGLPARVAISLPAELMQFVQNAHLPQLNPTAHECDWSGWK
jgi:hypothetical protein